MKSKAATREREVKIRLAEDELEHLNKNVAMTGLSRERYLRLLITEKVPVALPPADYGSIVRQLKAIDADIRTVLQHLELPYMQAKRESMTRRINQTAQYYAGYAVPTTLNTPYGEEVNPCGRFAD